MKMLQDIESPQEMYGLIHLALGALLKDCNSKEDFFKASNELVCDELDDIGTKECFLYVLDQLKPLSLEDIQRECDFIPSFIIDNYPETYDSLVRLEINLITMAEVA